MFFTVRRLLLVAIALALGACTSLTDLKRDLSEQVFGRENPNPPAELEEFKQTSQLQMAWRYALGNTGRYDFTPGYDGNAIYVADTQSLVKLDSNGKMLWKVTPDEPISGGVGVAANLILIGTAKGAVLAFDAAGKHLWKARVSSEVLSVPRYFEGVVIVRAGDSRIFGIDANDGSRKWVYERSTPALSLRSSAGIVADGGVVYAGFAGGKLAAIRADNGKFLWEATVAQPKGVTEIERIADITSLPVVDGSVVYAVAYQGKVAAIDRRSGKVAWNRDISSYNGLSIDGVRLVVSHASGSIYSLDYTNGKTYWRQGALAHRELTTPLAMSNHIVVGDLEGHLHALNREDGAFAARVKLDNNPVMPQLLETGNGQLIAQTRNGGLFAVSIK